MKTKTLTLGEVASVTGGRVAGDATRRVSGIAPLEDAGPDDLSLLSDPRYRRAAERSAAGSLLVKDGLELEGRDSVVVADPHFALAVLLPRIAEAWPEPEREIAGTASVAADARIGRRVAVGPFAVVASGCSIEDGARIGAGCVLGTGVHVGPDALLHPRVVVYPGCRIGARAVVHAGAVIGSDGFGFATKGGVHHKIPQVGRVLIEDDVEIGANTTIDRGSIGDTVIGAGTKIDNLVQIGHNVRIGAGCLIVAQAGISGSTRLGPGAVIAGQSGAAGHLTIGAGAQVASKSAVYADVAAGAVVSGIPAIDHRRWRRAQAAFAGLPEMLTRLRGIEERLGAPAEAPQPKLLSKAARKKSGRPKR